MGVRPPLVQALEAAGATLLASLLVGMGVALGDPDFVAFARVPRAIWILFPLLAGGLLGAVVPRLDRSLGLLLGMLLLGGGFGFAVLIYPEYVVERLGVEVAREFALQKVLQGVILAAPLSIAGLLVGHFLGARGSEPS